MMVFSGGMSGKSEGERERDGVSRIGGRAMGLVASCVNGECDDRAGTGAGSVDLLDDGLQQLPVALAFLRDIG